MAISPKPEVFFLFTSAGAPLTGQTGITFDTYKDDTGSNVANPTISEIGGGAYKFTPVFTAGRGIVYIINSNGANPARLFKFLRPEDYAAEAELYYKSEIKTSGPDANRQIFYDIDGTTVLMKFDLFDAGGAPTSSNVFKRVPV